MAYSITQFGTTVVAIAKECLLEGLRCQFEKKNLGTAKARNTGVRKAAVGKVKLRTAVRGTKMTSMMAGKITFNPFSITRKIDAFAKAL